MPKTTWSPRFFGTTRGRVLKLLCLASRTVSELAKDLGVTENAIRAHISALEEDGLVHQIGLRRGVRRPNAAYDLTPRGHQLFPDAHASLLKQLLGVISEQLPASSKHDLLRQAAERFSQEHVRRIERLNPKRRLAELMRVLGPLAELERDGGTLVIRGCGCPVAAVVKAHPEVCQLAAELLNELLDRPVRETCQREGEWPHCRFELV